MIQLLSKQTAQTNSHKQSTGLSGRTFFIFSFLGITFGGKKTTDEDPLIQRLKMASQELNELLQHADQLFDENNFKGAIELLKSFPVSFLKKIYFSFFIALKIISYKLERFCMKQMCASHRVKV